MTIKPLLSNKLQQTILLANRIAVAMTFQPDDQPVGLRLRTEYAAAAAQDDTLCEFCGRISVGLVAYCPHCGHKSSSATISQERDDRPQSEEALASGQGTLGMKKPLGKPLQGMPISGEALSGERNKPAPSQLSKTALPVLFKTAVAGLSVLLLFWMLVKLAGPKTSEEASPQLPISTSGIASPRPGPSTSAAQVPIPPQPNRRPLCSVVHETAGLCKSQE
jgi:hypothetical protein